ncbi:MAG TPA: FMN-binding negative transcriptional regulator [Stellaceae bacterium]|nr:FMN-binding negative transcriptional regulator [Stellaceae bacterium]
MYVPGHFREDRVEVLHQTMRRIALGTLVTTGAEGPEATHAPILIDAAPAPFGTLTGHVARANPHWRNAKSDAKALVIFLGPEGYISPGWYPTKAENGKVVPTWNYVSIHATGRLRFFDDAERLRRIVTRLTEVHEQSRAEPWHVSDAPADYIDAMLKAIVGFELVIETLEGKWKMSQNRPEVDRAGVVAGLTREGRSAEVAAIVEERSKKG